MSLSHSGVAVLIRWMIGIAIVDALIGAAGLLYFLSAGGTAANFRNGGFMLALGVVGAVYFWRLHARWVGSRRMT